MTDLIERKIDIIDVEIVREREREKERDLRDVSEIGSSVT